MLPELLEGVGPLVQRADGVGVGAIEHAAAVAANVDEVDVAKNAEMLGDGGLFDAQARDDIADGAFLKGQEGEDIAAARFGDGVEGVGGGGGARHKRRIHTHMGICQEVFSGDKPWAEYARA